MIAASLNTTAPSSPPEPPPGLPFNRAGCAIALLGSAILWTAILALAWWLG